MSETFIHKFCGWKSAEARRWTNPDGKQTAVRYIDETRTLAKAIKSAVHGRQPEACFPVFIASSMAEAKAMADARHAELSGSTTA